MPSFDPSRLDTVCLVPVTAFDHSGNFQEGVYIDHIQTLVAAGITALMPAAGTSENTDLGSDEIITIIAATRKAAPNAAIFAPLRPPTSEAIYTARECGDAGADGVMFMPLTNAYLCDPGAEGFYRTVLDAVKMPALVYRKDGDVPSDQLLLKLAQESTVVGTKYAIADFNKVRRAATLLVPHMRFICGNAERFSVPYMLLGAHGYTSGAGNIVPRLTLRLHSLLRQQKYTEALTVAAQIWPIEDARAKDGDRNNIGVLKVGLSRVLGREFGRTRPLFYYPSDAEIPAIEEVMRAALAAERTLPS